MGTLAVIYLPSGQLSLPVIQPRTWIEKSGATRGDPLRGKFLEADISGAVAWLRQRPLYQGYRSTTLSVNDSTWTAVGQDTELVDTHSGHSDTTNTGRWFAPDTNGAVSDTNYYLAIGYVSWNTADAANVFTVGIKKNTEANPREGTVLPRPAGHDVGCMVADIFALDGSANQYLELSAWHNHGAAATIPASSHVPSMTVRWVCAGSGVTVALPAAARTWTAADLLTATTSGGASVPLNTELRDRLRFALFPPIARLTAETSAQTIPSGAGTWTSIQLPTGNIDTYTGWSSGANTKYTFQRDGLYFCYGQAALLNTNAGAGTYVAARIRQNILAGGTTDYYGDASIPPTTATTGTTVAAHGLVRAVAGDSIELQASHNLGANKAVKTTVNGAARLIAVWVAR